MTKQTWQAQLYDDKHSFVSEYGRGLMTLLSAQENELILDLGCGTGDLTYQISQAGADVTGMDRSASMLRQAREKYPQLTFVQGDGTNFYFATPFDAVFSNAALHWIKQPKKVLTSVWNVLKSKGRFVAELGGKGNIESIVQAVTDSIHEMDDSIKVESPWYFPSIGEYTSLMEEVGFRVIYAVHFDRPTPLQDGDEGMDQWIKMFGGQFLQDIPPEKHDDFIQKVKDKVRQDLFKEGTWVADYKRIRVVGVKETLGFRWK